MFEETFAKNNNISLNDIRLFLNGRDGVNIDATNISLNNLFSIAAQNDITLSSGNYSPPHSMGEFAGATYSNIQLANPIISGPFNHSHFMIEAIIPEDIEYDYLEFQMDSKWYPMGDFRVEYIYNPSNYSTLAYVQYGHVKYSYENGTRSGPAQLYWDNVTKNGSVLTFSPLDVKDAWQEIKTIRDVGSTTGVYGLSSSSGGSLPDPGVNYALYVQMYEDLLHVQQAGQGGTQAQYGAWHWANYGEDEGRNLPTMSSTTYCVMDRGVWRHADQVGNGEDYNIGFFNSFDLPNVDSFKSWRNRSTSTRSGGSYSYTVPNGVYQIRIHAVGGGGGSWGAHTGGYCQNVWAGGVGGGAILTLPVQPGDVISGVYGNAGGGGYYNGGTGGPGSATTVYKNGALVVTCGAGGQGSNAESTQPGTATISSDFLSYGQTYRGTYQQNIFLGCDSSTDGQGYDPWNWIERGSRYPDNMGTLPFPYPNKTFTDIVVRAVSLPYDSTGEPEYFISDVQSVEVQTDRFHPGRAQCNGYVKIEEI